MLKKKIFCAAVTCETFLFDLNYFGLFIEVTHLTIQFQAAVQLQNRKLGSEESMLFSLSVIWWPLWGCYNMNIIFLSDYRFSF